MTRNYQPPNLQLFDRRGNLMQHIANFVETCSNGGTHDDLLVKQFFRSLKGNAFDLYIHLQHESIDSLEKLKQKVLNRFYNTHRTVVMIELTVTHKERMNL